MVELNTLSEGLGEIVVAAAGASDLAKDVAYAICDGVDDEVQINAALTEANGEIPVRLVGPSFNVQSGPIDQFVRGSRLTADPGVVVNIGTGFDGDANAAVQVFGGKDDVGALTADASQGDTSVTVASQAVVPFDGGWLSIHDNTDFSNRAQYENGQLVRCSGVSGSTINLYGRCETGYLTAASAEVDLIYPLIDVIIEGISFVVDPTTTNEPVVIAADYTQGLQIRGVSVNGSDDARRGIDVRRSIGAIVSRIYVERVQHGQRGANPAIGYGVCIRGCLNTVVQLVHGFRNRHTVEVGAIESDYPIDRHTIVRDCYAHYDYSSGFSTHGGAERTEFVNCEADTCGGGFFGRSPNLTFRSCTVRGLHNETDATGSDESVDHAYRFGEDTVTGPGCMRGVEMIDCHHLGESVSGFNNRTIHVAEDIIGPCTFDVSLAEAASDQPITFEGAINGPVGISGLIDMGNVGGVADPCIDFNGNIGDVVTIDELQVLRQRNALVQCSGGGSGGKLRVRKCDTLSVSGTGPAAQADAVVDITDSGTYDLIEVTEGDYSVWADGGSNIIAAGTATVTRSKAYANEIAGGALDAAYP